MKHSSIIIIVLLLCACGDGATAPPDACYMPDSSEPSCCDLLPDLEAVVACVKLPAGSCGHLVCFQSDCSYQQIPVCGPAIPMDAGIYPRP